MMLTWLEVKFIYSDQKATDAYENQWPSPTQQLWHPNPCLLCLEEEEEEEKHICIYT